MVAGKSQSGSRKDPMKSQALSCPLLDKLNDAFRLICRAQDADWPVTEPAKVLSGRSLQNESAYPKLEEDRTQGMPAIM